MKKIAVIFLALAAAACAAKKPAGTNTELINASVPQTSAPDRPEDFEKNMPESSIIRRSLIIFENTHSRVYSDDGVIDAAAGANMAAVLKPGEIGFTMPMCSALVLDGDFNRIWVSGYDAVVYGSSRLDYYSAYDCARYSSLKKALRGPAVIAGGSLLEWEGSKAVMRNIYTGDIIFNGDTGGIIASAGSISGRPVFVQENGYIMAYNEKAGAFTLEGAFPLDFSYLVFAGGFFYGVLKTGEFFTINDDETNIYPYKDCVLSSSSPYALCGGVLAGGGNEYHGLPQSQVFSAGAGLYLTLKENNLNIYSLENSWQRFVSFGYEMPQGCRDSSGAVYFKGFSGKVYAVSGGAEKEAGNIPQGCETDGISLENGKFMCGSAECGFFAEKINSDGLEAMYRRTEDGKIYYYFSADGESPAGAGAP